MKFVYCLITIQVIFVCFCLHALLVYPPKLLLYPYPAALFQFIYRVIWFVYPIMPTLVVVFAYSNDKITRKQRTITTIITIFLLLLTSFCVLQIVTWIWDITPIQILQMRLT